MVFVEYESQIDLTCVNTMPKDTYKKTSIERLHKLIQVAQKGIDRYIRVAVKGVFLIKGKPVRVNKFSIASVNNGELYLKVVDEVTSVQSMVTAIPTYSSMYKLYV